MHYTHDGEKIDDSFQLFMMHIFKLHASLNPLLTSTKIDTVTIDLHAVLYYIAMMPG